MAVKKNDDQETAAVDIAPAKEFEMSGAPIQTAPKVDASHPAVDEDPRADTSKAQNRIDFNDPTLSSEDAVAKALGAKGE